MSQCVLKVDTTFKHGGDYVLVSDISHVRSRVMLLVIPVKQLVWSGFDLHYERPKICDQHMRASRSDFNTGAHLYKSLMVNFGGTYCFIDM